MEFVSEMSNSRLMHTVRDLVEVGDSRVPAHLK
jgi:hypothetical protein